MFRSHKTSLILLFLLSSLLFFSFIGSNGLMEPDEGRYSEIPREMIESSDYVTPTLNYVKYFEKPVLHYWLTVSAFKLFGENEFASRFWPALLALAGVLVTYWIGSEFYNRKSGLFSGIILASSLLYFSIAQINLTDMPVSFFITLAMAGFIMARRREREWYILFYAGMALATLTKGLIGIVLPCAVIFWYMIIMRQWDIVRDALYLPGLAVFFSISVPWFWIVCQRNPDFFHFFFIQEHFLRYTTKMHHRYEPFWYFIPILLMGLLPWTGFLPGSLRNCVPHRLHEPDEDRAPGIFLLLWFGVIFLFFSASGSKLIPYLIPVFPPLAIIMGNRIAVLIDSDDYRGFRWGLLWNSLLTLPLGAAFIVYPWLQDKIPADILATQTVHKGIILIVGTAIAWFFSARKEIRRAMLCLILMAVLFTGSFKSAFFLYDRLNSSRQIAQMIEPYMKKENVIVQYGQYLEAVPFYLKKRNIIVNYKGELQFGASKEKDPRWFIDDQGLEELWRGDQQVFLIIRKNRLSDKMKKTLAPLHEVGTDWRKRNVIVSNRILEEASQ